MPQAWVEPHLVMRHKDVSVYRTYRNDNVNDPYYFHYTTDINENTRPFDIRGLSCYSHDMDHPAILKQAIEAGEIVSPGE